LFGATGVTHIGDSPGQMIDATALGLG